MGFTRQIIRGLAIAATFMLVSCIDCREEIWLNADGSGRADVSYTLPAAAAQFQGGERGISNLLEKFLKNAPGLTSSSHEVITTGDRMTIRVRAAFDSALDLKRISENDSMGKLPTSANGLAGEVKVGLDGRILEFSRTISPGKALPGAVFMPSSQFKGRHLTYILHLPLAPIESNATRTENGGRTLVWEQPLAEAIKSPFTTRFKARIPLPAGLIAAVGATTLASAFLAFLGVRKLRNVKATPV